MNKYTLPVVFLLAGGCAMFGKAPQHMSTGTTIPAAEGTAKFGKADNGNTSINLTVRHLAAPTKLTPPESSYVVWMRPSKDAVAQNIGALEVDKDLEGRLKTVTALSSFELFITAEASGKTQTPTGEPLLWTNYEQ